MSTFVPGARNSGSITDDMNRIVISGTPRTNSMNHTDIQRAKGILERRPSARMTPIGNDIVMPTVATTSVTSIPPQNWVSTTGRLINPLKLKNQPSMTNHEMNANGAAPAVASVLVAADAPIRRGPSTSRTVAVTMATPIQSHLSPNLAPGVEPVSSQ